VIVFPDYGWRRHQPQSPGEVALSGLLVAVLVAVWAVVLVPMWAHRQNVPSETEELNGARLISRRPHYQALALGRHSARFGSARALSAPMSRTAMLRRRRNVLLALTAALAVTVLGVLAGLPSALLAVPTLPYAGYLIWLRRTTVEAAVRREASERQVAEQRAAGFRDFGTPVADEAPVGSAPAAASPEALPADRNVTESAPDLGPSTAPWRPVPLPLPSYVTAPPAPTVIDGEWHEEMLLEGELPGEASAYALGDEALRQRAVGD
jgi:hypothetical protein